MLKSDMSTDDRLRIIHMWTYHFSTYTTPDGKYYASVVQDEACSYAFHSKEHWSYDDMVEDSLEQVYLFIRGLIRVPST